LPRRRHTVVAPQIGPSSTSARSGPDVASSWLDSLKFERFEGSAIRQRVKASDPSIDGERHRERTRPPAVTNFISRTHVPADVSPSRDNSTFLKFRTETPRSRSGLRFGWWAYRRRKRALPAVGAI